MRLYINALAECIEAMSLSGKDAARLVRFCSFKMQDDKGKAPIANGKVSSSP